MQVSVIVPTFNRFEQLKRVLAAFEQQTYPRENFQIIVVSDGSRDGTDDYLRAYKTEMQFVALIGENRGVAMARNRGVERAEGEYALFVDDDVVPSPQLIAEHMQTHAQHAQDVVVLGPMLTPNDFEMAPWVRWEQAMLVKQYDAMQAGKWEPTARQFYTGNTSLKRKHVVEAGGFDPTFRRAEDVELAYRLADRGLRFVFNANAIGWHYAIRSFKAWLDIPYAYGRNDVIFWRTKGQTWLLPTIWHEYHGRNPLIRGLTRTCLDHKTLSSAATGTLKFTAALGDRIGVEALPRASYSAIFNLRHYQGVADELGGRAKFFEGVAKTTSAPRPPGQRDVQAPKDFKTTDEATDPRAEKSLGSR